MKAVQRLRAAKHAAFVRLKPLRWKWFELTEPVVQAWHRRFPYRYEPQVFAGTFVVHDEPLERVTTEAVPRRIFCFWTGPNPMSEARERGLSLLRQSNPDVPVILVTERNLSEYLVPDHPLHPAYENLHYVHRSDYLRCYFLHFHGGGYADIKPIWNSWTGSFDAMDASAAWLMGYRNPIRLMTPNFAERRLERAMVRSSDVRLGQSSLIGRPNTPLTAEWWREVNRVLTRAADALARHPGDARGSDPDYPLAWNELLAQILDPLTFKYASHLLYDPQLFYDSNAEYL